MCPLCRPALGPASHRTLKSSSRPSCSFLASRGSLIFRFRPDHNTTETLDYNYSPYYLNPFLYLS